MNRNDPTVQKMQAALQIVREWVRANPVISIAILAFIILVIGIQGVSSPPGFWLMFVFSLALLGGGGYYVFVQAEKYLWLYMIGAFLGFVFLMSYLASEVKLKYFWSKGNYFGGVNFDNTSGQALVLVYLILVVAMGWWLKRNKPNWFPIYVRIMIGLTLLGIAYATGILQVVLAIAIAPFVIGFILTIFGGEWAELGNTIMSSYWQFLKITAKKGKRRLEFKQEVWAHIYATLHDKFGYLGDMRSWVDSARQYLPEAKTPEGFIHNFLKDMNTNQDSICMIGCQSLFDENIRSIPVRLHEERRLRHTWITGVTGTGKSTTIYRMVWDDIYKEKGLLLVTPRRDFIETHIMPAFWEWSYHQGKSALPIYFDATMETPLNWNPLLVAMDYTGQLTDQAPIESIEARADSIVLMFRDILPAPGGGQGWTPRMEEVLSYAAKAVIEQKGTFLDFYPLLDIKNREYRGYVIETTQDSMVREFFSKRFPERYNEYKESIVALYVRLSKLLGHRGIRKMLCSYSGKENPPALMKDCQTIPLLNLIGTNYKVIVNCSPQLGLEASQMLGRLFVSTVQASLAIREREAERDRTPFYIYLDEAQEFFQGAPTTLNYMLDASRQYKYGWALATPPLRSEHAKLKELLYSNCSNLLAFQLNEPYASETASRMITRKVTTLPFIKDYIDWMQMDPELDETGDRSRAKQRVYQLAEAAGIDTHQPERWIVDELLKKGEVTEYEYLDPMKLMQLPERSAYTKIGTAEEGGQWVFRMDVPPYEEPQVDLHAWKGEYADWVKEHFTITEPTPPGPKAEDILVNDRPAETVKPDEPIHDIKIIYPFRD